MNSARAFASRHVVSKKAALKHGFLVPTSHAAHPVAQVRVTEKILIFFIGVDFVKVLHQIILWICSKTLMRGRVEA